MPPETGAFSSDSRARRGIRTRAPTQDPTACVWFLHFLLLLSLSLAAFAFHVAFGRQFSPETRYARLSPPTGYVALTEHRDKARAPSLAGPPARALPPLRCADAEFCGVLLALLLSGAGLLPFLSASE